MMKTLQVLLATLLIVFAAGKDEPRTFTLDAGESKHRYCCMANGVPIVEEPILKTEAKSDCVANEVASESAMHFYKYHTYHSPDLHDKMSCMAECVHKGYKWLDEENNFDQHEIVEYMEYLSGFNQWLLDSVKPIVDKCLTLVKSMNLERDPANECLLAPLEFQNCYVRELTVSCPKTLQLDSPLCHKTRKEYVEDMRNISRQYPTYEAAVLQF